MFKKKVILRVWREKFYHLPTEKGYTLSGAPVTIDFFVTNKMAIDNPFVFQQSPMVLHDSTVNSSSIFFTVMANASV